MCELLEQLERAELLRLPLLLLHARHDFRALYDALVEAELGEYCEEVFDE